MSTPRPQIRLPINAAHRPSIIANFERLAPMAQSARFIAGRRRLFGRFGGRKQ
jgi:hypothetical protein